MFKSAVVNTTVKKLILSYCSPPNIHMNVHFAFASACKPFGPAGETERKSFKSETEREISTLMIFLVVVVG